MYLLRNATLVNEGRQEVADLLIKGQRIERIGPQLKTRARVTEIDCAGRLLLPGLIDDQVHFREPGFPAKATIHSEARAAVAGGVTSFMEMPNTNPSTTTPEALKDKMLRGKKTSLANYSFFFGATNDNLETLLHLEGGDIPGIKVFMGSSTGNMLVDDPDMLERLFAATPLLIATHCEDEETIRANYAQAVTSWKGADNIPPYVHPMIRSVEACVKSSSYAVKLARRYGTRLHVLHISTADELALFDRGPIHTKHITAEACVHHLWFTADDYAWLGNRVKCNPAIKETEHRTALWRALRDDRLDIVATDHAPHTLQEKNQPYPQAPSGLPLVQHGLQMMLTQGALPIERVVEKMCHAPAECFRVLERGYLREGYYADLVLLDATAEEIVTRESLHYHCGWSPLEGQPLKGRVTHTFVSGHMAYADGVFDESKMGEALKFGV